MSTDKSFTPDAEFSRPVSVEKLRIGKTEKRILANEEERAALAERFDLKGLSDLKAAMSLTRKGQGESMRLTVAGNLTAHIIQQCIISLDPVESRIDAPINAIYDARAEPEPDDRDLDPDIEEFPEPMTGGIVDLGELAAQVLALEIDPFPRREGADADGMQMESSDGEDNPFAALGKLKNPPE